MSNRRRIKKSVRMAKARGWSPTVRAVAQGDARAGNVPPKCPPGYHPQILGWPPQYTGKCVASRSLQPEAPVRHPVREPIRRKVRFAGR
jgi:hypothetical protein